MTPDEERAYLAALDRKWDRESWYRRPDGRLDWLALEGYVLMAIMVLGLVVVVLQEAIGCRSCALRSTGFPMVCDTACRDCNAGKSDSTLEAVGMVDPIVASRLFPELG